MVNYHSRIMEEVECFLVVVYVKETIGYAYGIGVVVLVNGYKIKGALGMAAGRVAFFMAGYFPATTYRGVKHSAVTHSGRGAILARGNGNIYTGIIEVYNNSNS